MVFKIEQLYELYEAIECDPDFAPQHTQKFNALICQILSKDRYDQTAAKRDALRVRQREVQQLEAWTKYEAHFKLFNDYLVSNGPKLGSLLQDDPDLLNQPITTPNLEREMLHLDNIMAQLAK